LAELLPIGLRFDPDFCLGPKHFALTRAKANRFSAIAVPEPLVTGMDMPEWLEDVLFVMVVCGIIAAVLIVAMHGR
jgi:hypothetical protein